MFALIVICVFAAPVCADSFEEQFDAPDDDTWELSSHDPGRAEIADGRLVLDLTTPETGKWAWALLHRSIELPATIRWAQRLADDSPHTYFCGLALYRRSGQWSGMNAGLGGGGLDDCVVLGSQREAHGEAEPGRWYEMRLELSAAEQVLTVTPRDADEPLATLTAHRALTSGPYFARFFQNDHRLGRDLPDGYTQNRGATWIDDLRIEAAALRAASPPPPGTSDPLAVPVVFNRATRWLTREDGLTEGCIAYDAAGRMPLTGERGVSRWLRLRRWVLTDVPRWPDQPFVRHLDADTSRLLLPPGETEATLALRAVQWRLDQHPTLRWSAEPSGVSWSLSITATDGAHPFAWELASVEETALASEGTLDLRETYRESGRPNRWAEMDFRVHLRATDADVEQPRLDLTLTMPGSAAVVPRDPVVAWADAAAEGVALETIAVDDEGAVVADARIRAEVGGRQVALDPLGRTGLRRAMLGGLAPGRHEIALRATDAAGRPLASGSALVTVTALPPLSHYEPAKRSYCTPAGEASGPLPGDLLAWVLYADVRGPDRRIIVGLDDYRRAEQAGRDVRPTKWRVMPREDIERYVAHLADSGVRVIRITPNVQVREYYLDAAGHLAMHGLEQLGFILDAARRHGIRAVINLFHYPYNQFGPPVNRYFELGYPDEMPWQSDEMWALLSQYLDELLGFIGDDPAVMAYTIMGENDQRLPVAWINRAHRFIKQRAPRQMVVLEQGGDIFNCTGGHPTNYEQFLPASDGGVGYRAYQTHRYPTDLFMAVCARFYRLAEPGYHGEVACGVKTSPQFHVKLRDAMGLAVALQQPMAISWSAPPLEEARKAFTAAAELIDWTRFRRAAAPVGVVMEVADRETVGRLVACEKLLAEMAGDCEYIAPDADREAYAATLDAREALPENAREMVERAAEGSPLRVSAGNHTAYALSADRTQMVAYVRNATHYEVRECDIHAVERCRLPDRPRSLRIELRGFDGSCRYRVLDAATTEMLAEGTVDGRAQIDLGATAADAVIAVFPD